MSDQELEKVASRVAEILSNGQPREGTSCVASGPPVGTNTKHIDSVVNQCVENVMMNLPNDDEQFIALGKIMDSLRSIWSRTAEEEMSFGNSRRDRADRLMRLIEESHKR